MKTRWVFFFIFLAGMAALVFHNKLPLVPWRPRNQTTLPTRVSLDDYSYVAMAEGRTFSVIAPFSKRALYPWMAGELSRVSGLSVATTFMALNIGAWALLAGCLATFLRQTTGHPWLAAVFLLTPFPVDSLVLGYMPDLFHTALLTLFFLLIWWEQERAAVAILIVAFLTRESTLLLCLCCAIVAWWRGRWKLAVAMVGVIIVCSAVTDWFAKFGRPNAYNLSDLSYLLLKVPYNFLRNQLGLTIWNNVIPSRGQPLFTMALPPAFQRGDIKVVGLAFSGLMVHHTYFGFLTVFGVLPLALWRWRKMLRGMRQWPLAIHLAFVYGLFSFLIGPSLGSAIDRLIAAGWPLVWIALPWCASHSRFRWSFAELSILVVCYLLAAWLANVGAFWPIPILWSLLVPIYATANICLTRAEAALETAPIPSTPEAGSNTVTS